MSAGGIMEILFWDSPVQQEGGSLEKTQLSLLVNFARNRSDLPSFSAG